MNKFLFIILLLLLAALQYHIWLGKGSYEEYDILYRMIVKQQQENIILQSRNDNLQADIVDLKTGFDSIEERARLELGMIKSNEVFYQFVE